MALTKQLDEDIRSTIKAWNIVLPQLINIPLSMTEEYKLLRYQRNCLVTYLIKNKRFSYREVSEYLGINKNTVWTIMVNNKLEIEHLK
jgi:hypothetical protein